MTPAEIETALKTRGCTIVQDAGDFALVHPHGDTGTPSAHDLRAKSRDAALLESWQWLHPDSAARARVAMIQRVVAQTFETTIADLSSKARPEPLATARRIAMSLSRELSDASLSAIADVFAKDRGTVIYARQSIAEQIEADHAFAGRYGAIRAACLAAFETPEPVAT